MTKRNGAHPTRRRRRVARAGLGDERPQGFQPERMRALWQNIDHARAKLEPETPESPQRSSLLGALVPSSLLALTPCALVSRASGWIAQLPGIDWLMGLWRSNPAS